METRLPAGKILNRSLALRSFSLLFGLALALGAAACSNASAGEEEDPQGSGGAISGTPSAATTPGWETLYEQAYAQDFTHAYCSPQKVSLLPAGKEEACDRFRQLQSSGASADVYEWKVKRNVTNAPREAVGTAWVFQTAGNGESRMYAFSDEEGTCILSGTVVNGKVGWDKTPSCGPSLYSN